MCKALATADQIATVPGMAWISTLHGGAIAGFVSDLKSFLFFFFEQYLLFINLLFPCANTPIHCFR